MSIDMSQFFGVFFEESQEHLASLESLLLSCDRENPDSEDLNAIFRAAHSIKGSAGTFGFTDLSEVTHDLETLLDLVRKRELALSEAIVDSCLQAGDVLKNLLAAHQGQGQADHVAAGDIRHKLSALANRCAAPSSAKSGAGTIVYLMRFRPAGIDKAAAADNLLRELSEIGKVSVADEAADDANSDILCLRIETTVAQDSLREVLDYVADSDSIELTIQDDLPPPTTTEAYGFFVSLGDDGDVVVGTAADDAGGSFGFFGDLDELLGSRESALASSSAEAVAIAKAEADGSFGLFDDIAAAPVVPSVAIAAGPSSQASEPIGTPKVSTGSAAEGSSIRVSVDRVDQLINLVGELVITQAMLAQGGADLDPAVHERILSGLVQLQRNTRDLQESVMSMRMLPISTVFSRFPRVVRDLSQKLGKQVRLVTLGEHTELDKTLIERIADPLTHLIRNSLDHGVESPDRRRAAGKNEQGTITLRAYHQSGNIVIEVGDDGGGLQREKILDKARERGMPVADSMTDQEVWMLIFEAGFSTAEQVSDVSGRGVGMDVVKKNIAALNGRIEINSMAGVGTSVIVRLPLTLAILDGMSVSLGNEIYILPLDYVLESLQVTPEMTKSVSGEPRLIQVRGEYLPLLRLREHFSVPGEAMSLAAGIAVVIESDGQKAALFVDGLIDQSQVVIKSLEANFRRVPGIAGATIRGDGRVALILDAPALIAAVRRTAALAA